MVDFTETYLAYDVNWKPVLVAAAVNVLLAFVWYSRAVFGNALRKAIRAGDVERAANAGRYVIAALGSLMAAYVLAVLAETTLALSWQDGAMLGFVLWLGPSVSTSMVSFISEGRKDASFLIHHGYGLVALVVMGAIVGGWTA